VTGRGRKPPAELAELREDFVAKQAALEQASIELRAVLREVETATRRGRRHIREGGWAIDVPGVADVADVRLGLADKMAAVDRARMRSRVANVRLAVAEGSSLSEIAREYRLSRQFVSRALKAADE
jgi:hypothetical protein